MRDMTKNELIEKMEACTNMDELHEVMNHDRFIDQIECYIDDLQLVLRLYRKFGRMQDAIADMNGIGKDLIRERLSDYK
jgi:hypothetical protein